MVERAPAGTSVRRVDFGWFVRPSEETSTGAARVEPCLGYLVEHPAGVLLFDTGMGSDPDVDAHYGPVRRPLREALSAVGSRLEDLTLVANCHLHFDHCGGNPELVGRPFVVQSGELADARTTPDYTLPRVVDPDGVRWLEVTGPAELLPGVSVVPTGGHTPGHQSLVVALTDGTVVVAGQSHDRASDWAADALAERARQEAPEARIPTVPSWLPGLLELDPRRVCFAHDHAVWSARTSSGPDHFD